MRNLRHARKDWLLFHRPPGGAWVVVERSSSADHARRKMAKKVEPGDYAVVRHGHRPKPEDAPERVVAPTVMPTRFALFHRYADGWAWIEVGNFAKPADAVAARDSPHLALHGQYRVGPSKPPPEPEEPAERTVAAVIKQRTRKRRTQRPMAGRFCEGT